MRFVPSEAQLREWLARHLASTLGIPSERVDPAARFNELGLSSAGATALVLALGTWVGRALPPTLLWEQPTVDALVTFLTRPLAPQRKAPLGRVNADEPIAVVGMACRFPGAPDLRAYAQLLREGRDAVREVPDSRWSPTAWFDADPQAPGKMSTRWAGLLESVDTFDARFFGISPQEATQMDPQQRLALELAWEACEDAGVIPSRLKGSATGVFLGAMWSDYARLHGGGARIAQHTAVGQDLSIISGRISYFMGLRGPSMTVNTACSSSLVAVHLACQSLRAGESTVALAGGVNLLLSPESTVAMSKFGAMAPDGRCKAFDARADGYVRGEGGGLLVLKPLSRAILDGDRIHLLILGSAVNNDGFSNGLTAPSGEAQEEVLRRAYASAGVEPSQVQYVEAHGTGTRLGDPIEANALGAVLGEGRGAESPLVIGSVKTQLGHLEAAAGIAGLIKVALAMQESVIPRSLHFETPNPLIDFQAHRMRVASSACRWREGARFAGVSSFGFGGTNAHVVLQDPEARAPIEPFPKAPPRAARPSLVWVFPGQGGQWIGMGRSLLRDEPVFRAAMQHCDEALAAHVDWSLRELLLSPTAEPRLAEVDVIQPVLFAVQVSLARLWSSWGAKPDVVVGHSLGEIAAAHVAGALSLRDATRIVCVRSRLLRTVSGRGAMVAVELSLDLARERLRAGVEVAVSSGPRSTVLAGDVTALTALVQALTAEGVGCRWINVDVASHSAQVEPLLPQLRAGLEGLSPHAAHTPLISTVSAKPVLGPELDAAYWCSNLRSTVLFASVIESLLRERGERVFLELSPNPVLRHSLEELSGSNGGAATVLASIRRDQPERTALLESVDALQRLGFALRGDARSEREELVPFSARTPGALAKLLSATRERLRGPNPPSLRDLAFTACTRREHGRERMAFVAQSIEELARLLEEACRNGKPRSSASSAEEPARAAALPRGAERRKALERLASEYERGATLRLEPLFPEGGVVTPLPAYPFERERFWFDAATPVPQVPPPAASAAAPHPVDLAARLSTAAQEDRERLLVEHIQIQVAAVFGLSDTHVNPDESFTALGMDSLMGIRLAKSLGASLKIDLSSAIAFDYDHVASLARYLSQRLAKKAG